jgi:hypothetical protein
MRSLIKNTVIYKILQLFYGELFNTSNTLPTRIMRIICRTPLNSLAYYLYKFLFKKDNSKPVVFDSQFLFESYIHEDKIFNELKKDGISLNINLHKTTVMNILKAIEDSKFQVNRDLNSFIRLKDKKKNDNVYICRLRDPHQNIEEVKKIAYNKNLFNLVQRYLRVTPIVHSTQIWWTYPYYISGMQANPPGNEFGFHYDVDDFKFLKLFFYLSKVNNKCGPHYYIKNNGRKSIKEFLDRRLSDDEAKKLYNDRILTITGDIGSGFIEDASFYHKGSNPELESGRGILQIIYSVSRW